MAAEREGVLAFVGQLPHASFRLGVVDVKPAVLCVLHQLRRKLSMYLRPWSRSALRGGWSSLRSSVSFVLMSPVLPVSWRSSCPPFFCPVRNPLSCNDVPSRKGILCYQGRTWPRTHGLFPIPFGTLPSHGYAAQMGHILKLVLNIHVDIVAVCLHRHRESVLKYVLEGLPASLLLYKSI